MSPESQSQDWWHEYHHHRQHGLMTSTTVVHGSIARFDQGTWREKEGVEALTNSWRHQQCPRIKRSNSSHLESQKHARSCSCPPRLNFSYLLHQGRITFHQRHYNQSAGIAWTPQTGLLHQYQPLLSNPHTRFTLQKNQLVGISEYVNLFLGPVKTKPCFFYD